MRAEAEDAEPRRVESRPHVRCDVKINTKLITQSDRSQRTWRTVVSRELGAWAGRVKGKTTDAADVVVVVVARCPTPHGDGMHLCDSRDRKRLREHQKETDFFNHIDSNREAEGDRDSVSSRARQEIQRSRSTT